MPSILIAESEEPLRNALVLELRKEFVVYSAKNGDRAMALLRSQKPDILILSLSLHGTDGLLFLEEAGPHLPPRILCLTNVITDYIAQAAKGLGADYILLKPCTLRSITRRVQDMAQPRLPEPSLDPEKITARHLQLLGIQPSWDGFLMLCIAIPLFAQDTTQRLAKDLYPQICSRCNCCSDVAVERSIRMAIERAWALGRQEYWQEYFPGISRRPSNRDFISRLSQLL